MRWLLLALVVGCSGSDDEGTTVDAGPRPDAPAPPDAGRERCTHHTTTMMNMSYACTVWYCCLTATGNSLKFDSCALGSTYPACEACREPTYHELPCH